MIDDDVSFLSAAEEQLRRRFHKEFVDGETIQRRLPSDAAVAETGRRVDQLALPDNMRAKMPFTKDKYLVKEDPNFVDWEREVRKFLRRLSPEHGHRVTASMVFEWCTGLRVADLMALEKEQGRQHMGRRGTWRADMRKISKLLEYYFGKPYMTYIAGHKVPRAYKVKPGYYIKRHRPQTLQLYAEYVEGVLNP